jgi:hypothetical protein
MMEGSQIYEGWRYWSDKKGREVVHLGTPEEIGELKASGEFSIDRSHYTQFLHRIFADSFADAKRQHQILIGRGDYGPESLVRPYPKPSDVFGEPLEMHAKHFLPSISVHSSLLWDDVDSWLHFVAPVEPLMEGYIGEFTRPYHDFYNKEGQVSLSLIDGRYMFQGDWNYFAYESGVIPTKLPYTEEQVRDDYQQRFLNYDGGLQEFQKTKRCEGIKQLGGEPVEGNLGSSVKNVRNQNGNPFRFVGEVGGRFAGNADGLLMFFDPEESVVVLMSDFM